MDSLIRLSQKRRRAGISSKAGVYLTYRRLRLPIREENSRANASRSHCLGLVLGLSHPK